mgnify:FL=1|jgi:uncharacterized membrane protein YhaH (DUF805 family)|tara:strand:- start:146 stop:538 length:393 start_codon:yes stop_codon:yes gene_type:complete
MEWYLKVMRDNYANFKGRARRKEYWMYTLIFTVLLIALMTIMFSVLSFSDETGIETGPGVYLTVILVIVFLFAHFIPTIALTVRRLHDTGKSGWWYLIVLVPYLGNFVIFIFTLIDGDRGDNKYGSNPKI